MNLDRINERYHGNLADPTTERARERIHWICGQATGSDVLDIGCSQGIVCLILGREGFRCMGVDLERASLSVAREALAKEDKIVQERVAFQIADASKLPFKNESFDTIVLGEVLEHLAHPGKVLEEARRVLREGGRLVVTVPHGLSPYHDHKRTYYPISLLDLLRPLFRAQTVDILNSYITYAGVKDRAYQPAGISGDARLEECLRWEQELERRCLEKERALFELGTKLYAQVKSLTTQSQAQADRIRELEEAVAAKNSSVQELEEDVQQAAISVESLREGVRQAEALQLRLTNEATSSRAALAEVEQRFAELQAETTELRKDIISKDATVARLNTQLENSQAALADADGNRTALRAEIAGLRKDLISKDAAVARLNTELENSQAALADADGNRAALRDEIAGLRKDLDAKDTAGEQRVSQMETMHAARQRELERRVQDLVNTHQSESNRKLANQRIRDVVRSILPLQSRVLVISKGDEDLLLLDGRCGAHFPQAAGGVYAGHHPADSAEAIAHLEALKANGAEFLLIPASSFWWLDFYAEFRQHLEEHYALLTYHEDTCVIFSLSPASTPGKLRPRFSFPEPVDRSATLPTPPQTAVQKAPPVPGPAPSQASPSALPAKASQVSQTIAAPPRPASRKKPLPTGLTVGAILDEFTTACFAPECSLVTFRPDNWKAVIDRTPIDMLFVESAWRGNDGAWQYKIVSVPKGDELDDLIKYCRSKHIPTVFWNKEDPAHFDRFIKSASLFDCVFTTDSDCVTRYQECLQHERNYALPFAAQPRIHHPVLTTERLHNVCFAGAYYRLSHDERRKDMDLILQPALEFGLHIFDRQHGLVGPGSEHYRFPDIYQPAIKGRLGYDQMVRAYKRYRVFMNVNSVKTSPTMFSRRVFELLACGTPVISAYARGIENLLGTDVVAFATDEKETKRHLERLLNNEIEWARASTKGIRAVFDRHTYAHRWHALCQQVDRAYAASRPKTLTVIAVLDKKTNLRRLTEVLAEQTYRHFTVRLVLQKGLSAAVAEPLMNALPDIAVQVVPGVEDVPATCARADSGDYSWLVQPGDFYGPNFLKDLMLAVGYSDAEFIGKHTHFVLSKDRTGLELTSPGYEYRHVQSLPPGSFIAKRGSLAEQEWSGLLRRQTFQTTQRRVLSIDRFNYVRNAYPATKSQNGQPAEALKQALI